MKLETANCIKILLQNESMIHSEFQVSSLSIFGSTARGDQNEESDVDIIVDMPPKLKLVVDLKEFLEKLLDKPVDLIRRHSHLSTEFLTSVAKDEISIF
ncbi:MAG: nucleotidyltransferase domain-containing protein [Muribaculaceae bacterium]|nr:nucleotidyltransferase domain-containing protein [Muribaculaceae bacterium]